MNKIKVHGSFSHTSGIMAFVSALALASAAISPSAAWATLTDGKGIALNVLSPKLNSFIKTDMLHLRVTTTDYHLDAGFAGSAVNIPFTYARKFLPQPAGYRELAHIRRSANDVQHDHQVEHSRLGDFD